MENNDLMTKVAETDAESRDAALFDEAEFERDLEASMAADAEAQKESVGSKFARFTIGEFQSVMQIPDAVMGGMWDGALNSADLVGALTTGVLGAGAKAVGVSPEQVDKTAKEMLPSSTVPSAPKGEGDGIVGGVSNALVRPLTQFLTPYSVLGKAGKGLTTASKLGKYLKSVAIDGASAMAAFSGDEGRLSDVLEAAGISPFDFLTTDKNDSKLMAKFKTGLEAMGLAAIAEPIISLVKMSRDWHRAKTIFKDGIEQSKGVAKRVGQYLNAIDKPDAPLPQLENAVSRNTKEYKSVVEQLKATHDIPFTEEQLMSGEIAEGFTKERYLDQLNKVTAIQADAYVNEIRPGFELAMDRLVAGDKSAVDDAIELATKFLEMDGRAKDAVGGVAGRAMQLRGKTEAVQMANVLRENLLKADSMTRETTAKILAKLILDNPADVNMVVKNMRPKMSVLGRVEAAAKELYTNSLLSSPVTHAADAMNTLFWNGVMLPLERIPAGLIGRMRQAIFTKWGEGMDRAHVREAFVMWKSFFDSASDAVRYLGKEVMPQKGIGAKLSKVNEGLKSLREGSVSRFDTARGSRAISAEAWGAEKNTLFGRSVDFAGNAINIPAEVMSTKDDVVKAMLYQSELRTRALRRATMENLEGVEFKKRVDEIMQIGMSDIKWEDMSMVKSQLAQMGKAIEDPIEISAMGAIVQKSKKQAQVDTFTNEMGAVGKAMQDLAKNVPGMWLVMPFVKTPGNILRQTVARTPFEFLFDSTRQTIMRGGAEADLALSRIATGTTLATTGWAAAQNGFVTGRMRAANQSDAAAARELGMSPNSIKIGNTFVNAQRFDPLSTFLILPANIAELVDYVGDDRTLETEEDLQNVMSMYILGTSQALLDKTYTAGLAKLLDTVVAQRENQFSDLVNFYASNFVPGSAGLRFFAQNINPIVQESDKLLDKIAADVGFGKYPKYNPLVEPIRGNYHSFLPIQFSVKEDDMVFQQVLDSGANIRLPRRNIDQVELSLKDYHEFLGHLEKQKPRQVLEKLIQSPRYRKAPATTETRLTQLGLERQYFGSRKQMLEIQYNAMVEKAREDFLKSRPDIAGLVNDAKTARREQPAASTFSRKALKSLGKTPTFNP